MNGNTTNLVKALAQAGLAGVAIAALFILWSLVGNHINHNTEMMTKVYESSQAQVGATGDLVRAIDRLNFLISNE